MTFTWIPRERNKHADALANGAMDAAAGLPERPEKAEARVPSSWEPRAAGAATRLLLVRHGETALNAPAATPAAATCRSPSAARRRRGHRRRVAALAPATAAVVTSPLVRCTRTAAAIAAALGGVPVVVDQDLIECDFGEWEGLTFAEVRERWPDRAGRLARRHLGRAARRRVVRGGGHRARRATAALRTAYPRQTVVVVSHVSPIKLILRDALAAGDAFLHRLYLDPAGLSTVDFWPDGGIAVRSVNDTAHL